MFDEKVLNYGTFIANKIICNKENQSITIKIDEAINSFTDTVIRLTEDQLETEKCTHINFINIVNKNSILIKIDHLNSKHKYVNSRETRIDLLDKYFVKKGSQLFLKKNEINIDEDIYIPNNFEVIVESGQKILLTNNAFIFSNSPWIIGGKGEETIITGKKDDLGGGLIVGDNNQMSKITNTKISYLNGYNNNKNFEHLIMGAINFYETSVEINNVDFDNIFSEDAINIIRSNFEINNSKYTNIFSDAIDIDFSDGKIESVTFKMVANDAMDFSGSNVDIYDSYFDNVNDKLISGGERSNLKISKVKAINSKSGIISKDGSKVYSKNIFFENVKIPFAAYQKKKEYDYGLLVIEDFKIKNFLVKYAKDKKSKIILDNLVQGYKKNNRGMLSFVN